MFSTINLGPEDVQISFLLEKNGEIQLLAKPWSRRRSDFIFLVCFYENGKSPRRQLLGRAGQSIS
jgi:hypothetical protein